MDKPFHIFEITREFVDVLRTKQEDAHFHDFEELIIIAEGSLEHYIDFQSETVSAPLASYVSLGKMHRVIPHDDLRGWVINYQNEFIPDSKLNFYSNFISSANIPIAQNGCESRFVALCKIIHAEYIQENPDLSTIRHLTTGLISMIDSERKRIIPIEKTIKASQIDTFNNF